MMVRVKVMRANIIFHNCKQVNRPGHSCVVVEVKIKILLNKEMTRLRSVRGHQGDRTGERFPVRNCLNCGQQLVIVSPDGNEASIGAVYLVRTVLAPLYSITDLIIFYAARVISTTYCAPRTSGKPPAVLLIIILFC